jgi:hypothetical protein
LSTAIDMVALYIAAEQAVLAGKSYSVNGRQLSRENLTEIRQGRREWEQRVIEESAATQGGSALYSVADWR